MTMRDNLEAYGSRPWAIRPARRWRGRTVRLWLRRAPERGRERLEVLERLAAEGRRARRAGEYAPGVGWDRRWR